MLVQPSKQNIVTDISMRAQFDYVGQRWACFGNMDKEEIWVVDPRTFEKMHTPQLDVEYPMLRSGLSNLSCKFYENSMVTQSIDQNMRDAGLLISKRDWYDVTMLVRTDECQADVHSIFSRPRHSRSVTEQQQDNVVPLFARAPE